MKLTTNAGKLHFKTEIAEKIQQDWKHWEQDCGKKTSYLFRLKIFHLN